MEKIEKQIKLIYSRYEKKPKFTCEEVIDIFNYFFETHEAYTGVKHWNPRGMQIKSIIDRLPECEDPAFDTPLELLPEHYPPMIENYYHNYSRIDNYGEYNPNIEHFLAGCIRAICFYESCY